ncbi:ketopantoate reductase family protein [Acetobacter cerevisiae]|nr:ketopantoate reductase [Acetobacter cerevisiae]
MKTVQTHSQPRVCIAGMGGIGGLLAAHLSPLDVTLSVVARGETLHALQHNRLRCSHGTTTASYAVQADSRSPDAIQDLVVLCGKYHQLPSLIETVSHSIGQQTKIMPVVNGYPWWMTQPDTQASLQPILDPTGTLTSLNRANVCGCVAYALVEVESPGQIRYAGSPRFFIGDAEPNSGCAQTVLTLLGQENHIFYLSQSIQKDLWAKLCLNVSTNLLSVLLEMSLQELAIEPDIACLTSQILTEMHALARASGLSDPLPIDTLMNKIAQGGTHPTSMLQDYRYGRPLELSALGDAILALAHHYHVPIPVTNTVLILTRNKAAMRDAISNHKTG